MANNPATASGLFDGPFNQPMREADRFQGAQGLQVTPDRLASGNLSDEPPGEPEALGRGPGAVPWSGLRSGR